MANHSCVNNLFKPQFTHVFYPLALRLTTFYLPSTENWISTGYGYTQLCIGYSKFSA